MVTIIERRENADMIRKVFLRLFKFCSAFLDTGNTQKAMKQRGVWVT